MVGKRQPDGIVAIATATGRGGIGIVRLSGPALGPFAESLIGAIPQPRVATLSRFLGADGLDIDEGIALYFPAPHSYTGEDVLELQGHGGSVVMQLLLQRCLELGLRLAEPGEFTLRAYLNGKLDLAQAEAVADLVEASTAAAARSAVRSLSGEFSGAVGDIIRQLIDLRVQVEAMIDFPEEETGSFRQRGLEDRLTHLAEAVDHLLVRARQGSLLRSGLQVVLAGQPNVGKSSLLNALAGDERAIVTAIPGTTRDALREAIQVDGIPLHIVDTAGLRETEDEVEQHGIARSWKEIERADIVLLMLDAREGMTSVDQSIADRLPSGVEQIILFNKCDLISRPAGREVEGNRIALWLSAKNGEGLELLKKELLRVAGWQPGAEGVFLARERHLLSLAKAKAHLFAGLQQSDRPELMAEELRLAQIALSTITGEFTPDDLLGEIFSSFCIGK